MVAPAPGAWQGTVNCAGESVVGPRASRPIAERVRSQPQAGPAEQR